MKTSGTVAAGLSLLLMTLPLIGCGINTDGSTGTLSPVQTEVATEDLYSALAVATVSAGYMDPGVGKAEVSAVHNLQPSALAMLPSVVTPRSVNPLTAITLTAYTYNCPGGGTIVVNGSVSGTSASASFNITETINSCTDSGFTMSGNPNVTISGSETESGSVVTDTITMTGGFTTGGKSCPVDVNFTSTVNSSTYATTVNETGSICGETLTFSYSGTA
jgi:hypothetical protein